MKGGKNNGRRRIKKKFTNLDNQALVNRINRRFKGNLNDDDETHFRGESRESNTFPLFILPLCL